jgi:hypothetical protein
MKSINLSFFPRTREECVKEEEEEEEEEVERFYMLARREPWRWHLWLSKSMNGLAVYFRECVGRTREGNEHSALQLHLILISRLERSEEAI